MCLYPRLITNRKYIPNKKNGGVVPEMKDPRVATVPVGCGRCIECMKQKGREWSIRLQEEIRTDNTGTGLALPTYYRNKIYTEEEREELWLIKLNQNVRYVDGVKIDVEDTHEHYYNQLKQAQAKNERLGYTPPEAKWDDVGYQEKRAKLQAKNKLTEFRPTEGTEQIPLELVPF